MSDYTLTQSLGIGWPSDKATKWLRDYAASLSREAKYVRENIECGLNQEEFELFLEQGLGFDEDDIKEITAKLTSEKGGGLRNER